VSLPSKPVLDREGKQAKPDAKPQFAPVLEWRSREISDHFSASVITLIRTKYPDALGGACADG